jgi:hypothetical protein
MEGYVFMKAVLMNPERSIADDNFAIIDSVLRRIVVPAVVLFFALRLIWLGHCAS